MKNEDKLLAPALGSILFALAGLLFATAALALPPRTSDDLVWTAPETPIAGRPSTLLFALSLLTDAPIESIPTTSVEGNTVTVDLGVGCIEAGRHCDIVVSQVFSVELPALAAGDYTVKVHRAAGSDTVLREFPLHVEGLVTIPEVDVDSLFVTDIADGFWSVPGQPGTGLYLQQRGNVIAVGVFDYQSSSEELTGLTSWQLDAGILHDGAVALPLHRFHDGSCFGCEPHEEPVVEGPIDVIRIRFDSARRAWVDINGVRTVPIVSFPFGVNYVGTLADTVDEEFDALPLPDLRGEWVLSTNGEYKHDGIEIPKLARQKLDTFDSASTDGNATFYFSGPRTDSHAGNGETWSIRCQSAQGGKQAGCELYFSPDTALLPPAILTGSAKLGDIQEDHILFTGDAEGYTFTIEAIRLRHSLSTN